jgi:CRP-like cAMP-binding protein
MAISILNTIFSEKDFSPSELQEILPCFKEVTFEKNEFLLEEGRSAQQYWFIESGLVRSFAVDTEGNDVSTNFYMRGDLAIDWPSFLMRTPTRENLQALTKTICWQLDFEKFQKLFHGIEAFREAGRGRLVKSYFELKQRSVSLITDQAKDRYVRLITEKPDVIQKVSLKQIASYLGVTDTSLSRIRKEITKDA